MGKGSGTQGGSTTTVAGNSFMRSVFISYACVFVWITLSFSVIIFNKYILDRKMYNWPFPISLTMIHMAFCSSLAFLLVKVFRVVEPISMSSEMYFYSVVPIGALYALSLWFSNSAYIYLSVSFIQMLKALMPAAVYSIGVGVKKEVFKLNTAMNMACITIGVAIAAYGEANFVWTGIFLQLGAVAVEATRLVLIQILLTSKGINLNPITSLYYVAPCCFVFLSVPFIVMELPKLMAMHEFKLDLFTFGTNSLCAFALNLAVFLLIGKTSALTMNVAGVVKDWLLIAFSWSVIADQITTINLVGYALAFLGVCWYNNSKLQDMRSRETAKKLQQQDEENGLLAEQREDEELLPTSSPTAGGAKGGLAGGRD